MQQIGRALHLVGMALNASEREGRDLRVSFADFYSATRDRAMRLAWLLTHDAHACDDIVHDAYARVMRHYESIANPDAYLRSAIVNRVKERSRLSTNERRRTELVGAGQLAAVEGPTGGVIDAVATLPTAQRVAVVLRYWADLPDDEIADILHVRPATVRSLLSRALKALRKDITP